MYAPTMGLLPCYSCVGLLRWALLLLPLLLSGVLGDCSRPNMPNFVTLRNGTLQNNYPVGTVLQYRCIPGYENIPGTIPSIQCLDNSAWSETPTFCRGRKCRPPNFENGRIISTGDLRLGEEITFTCEPGYRLIGQNKARCDLAKGTVDWNRVPPYCQQILCYPPPPVANGGHSGDDTNEYTYGTAVTYKCNAGLSLIGSKSIACTTAENGVDGKWSPAAPECKVVACKRPVIQNGRVESVFQATYTYGNTIMIACDLGHTLYEDNFIQCGADSLWHPAVPTCIKRIFTTTITTTTAHPGDTQNETIGPPTMPTRRPTRRTTTTGSTKGPDETDPNDGSGTSKTVGIVLGAGFAVIIGIGAAFFIAKKYRKKGKTDPHLGCSSNYHIALGKELPLEEKELWKLRSDCT